jgi:hypothetical protein
VVNTTEALKIALKLAIDALENTDRSKLFELERNAIAAIKAALAQPNSEYERGFVDGMQKQMQSSVDKAVNAPIKLCGPNLVEILNSAGFYRREWAGLTTKDIHVIEENAPTKQWAVLMTEATLKEKNT